MNKNSFKLFRSATVGISGKNFKLLIDPWLTDGEYYGSWFHYPKFNIKKNLDELNSFNAIYISHIHPDHSSVETLKLINKNIPIYILSYHSKFLKFKLENLGFKVIELEHGNKFTLDKDFNITLFAADDCDPQLCFKFYGCSIPGIKDQTQQIDSLALMEVSNKKILNVNDSPFKLSEKVIKKNKSLQNLDLLLTGYGGAGPFPQCFQNLSEKDKNKEAKKKEENFIKQSISYIQSTNTKNYIPFAGTYYLAGKLSKLQYKRGVPSIDETYNKIDKYLKSNSIKTKSIKINLEATLSLKDFASSEKYKPLNSKLIKNYIKKISKRKLDYEKLKSPESNEIFALSQTAFERFINKKSQLNLNLRSDIFIKLKKNYIKINNILNKISLVKKADIKKSKSYVIYDLDDRLLKQILKGPKFAHWNNAEIGSHIKFYRKPNIFERNLYYAMSFFHN
jgi:UDP-MurNAc hydroxylase